MYLSVRDYYFKFIIFVCCQQVYRFAKGERANPMLTKQVSIFVAVWQRGWSVSTFKLRVESVCVFAVQNRSYPEHLPTFYQSMRFFDNYWLVLNKRVSITISCCIGNRLSFGRWAANVADVVTTSNQTPASILCPAFKS